MARTSKSSRKHRLDFRGVESGGGGSFHIPEGRYGMRVEEIKKEISSNDNEMFTWIFKGTEGKAKGKKFYFHTALTSGSMWKLKETLEALGIEIPDSYLDLDFDELEGLEAIGEVEDNEWPEGSGKMRSSLAKLVNGEDGIEEEEEEETPKRGSVTGKRSTKKAAVKLSADEVKEMSEDELDGVVDKYNLGVDLGDYKTLGKKAAAVIEALEEVGSLEEQEEEEEEEEAPAPRRRTRR